jgi:hypothetical protein
MDEYQSLIGLVSMTMGVAWASGINLYAALAVLGFSGITGNIDLPPGLEILENPLVIAAAGFMYVIEFVADKIPGVDSTWDAVHTFIRIPAGGMLAMGTVGDASPALELAAAIMGGGLAATSHAAKAGTRLAVNASPEPFTNWGLSITEDVAVVAGLWAALAHPWIFVGLMIVFLILAIWLLPKIWRAVKFIFRKIGEVLGLVSKQPKTDNGSYYTPPGGVSSNSGDDAEFSANSVKLGMDSATSSSASSVTDEIDRIKALLDKGAITEDEYELLKKKLL